VHMEIVIISLGYATVPRGDFESVRIARYDRKVHYFPASRLSYDAYANPASRSISCERCLSCKEIEDHRELASEQIRCLRDPMLFQSRRNCGDPLPRHRMALKFGGARFLDELSANYRARSKTTMRKCKAPR